MSESAGESNRVALEPNRVFENCASCGRETPHSVSIEIRKEGASQNQIEYSREPYRITVCDRCGKREQLRMNNQ